MAVCPGSLILGVCIEERRQYRRQRYVRRLDEHFSPPSDEGREAFAKDQSGSSWAPGEIREGISHNAVEYASEGPGVLVWRGDRHTLS